MKQTIIKESSTLQGSGEKWAKERAYLKKHIQDFIEQDGTYRKSHRGYEPDYKTSVRILALDYILQYFSLLDLYYSFAGPPIDVGFSSTTSHLLIKRRILFQRKATIHDINDNVDLISPEQKKKMRRRVWDTPPIIYGIILELISESRIFWNDETGEYIQPKNLLL